MITVVKIFQNFVFFGNFLPFIFLEFRNKLETLLEFCFVETVKILDHSRKISQDMARISQSAFKKFDKKIKQINLRINPQMEKNKFLNFFVYIN